jgi:hypothetical protein
MPLFDVHFFHEIDEHVHNPDWLCFRTTTAKAIRFSASLGYLTAPASSQ